MWIWLILIYLIPLNVFAANPYKLGELDYFESKSDYELLQKKDRLFDWSEGVMGVNGQTSVYTPPAAILSLLENPTRANAKAYLDWQRLKVQKIIKAQQVIDDVIKEGER